MAWRLCVVIAITMTLVAASVKTPPQSLLTGRQGSDTDIRFLRVANNDEERASAPVEAVVSLAKNKNVANAVVDALPSKLEAIVEKKYPLVVPGVTDLIIRARMKRWYWKRTLPTKVFKKLGLRGHLTEARLKNHPFYKYYAEYLKNWGNTQAHLNTL
ncbi:hypothetical protein V7S43_015111 [Phytophthora oleae]|uniref:RxLR effector protein n=1 Tax=Phytophthora oleae TaxID=2107226 RepID=A0ABD3F3W6_9STRA